MSPDLSSEHTVSSPLLGRGPAGHQDLRDADDRKNWAVSVILRGEQQAIQYEGLARPWSREEILD